MTLFKKLKNRRGFTLAELLIVIAIISILAGLAFLFINPKDVSYVEYNRSAEAIATAAQNRLTEIRNTGDMERLRSLGVSASQSAGTASSKTAVSHGLESSDGTYGGYRYVFSYEIKEGAVEKNYDVNYIVPFGAIDYELSQNYYAIGFQSDTGMVGEVFYSVKPFDTDALTADYLISLASNPDKRKAENIGYYQGDTYDSEVAFANLPTPQLTITNYEELTLSIYLPKVKQLDEYGKNLGILVSLTDEDGEAFTHNLSLNQTAIYSTFSLGSSSGEIDIAGNPQPIVVKQEVSSGATYNIVLDTVKKCQDSDMRQQLSLPWASGEANITPPTGKFESWAVRSEAYKQGYYLLGDNSTVTVTVYCLYDEGDANYDEYFPVDPTFMPRSASVTFNGWFNNYKSSTAYIACGRHLQNLGNLTEMRDKLTQFLPGYVEKDGVYEYLDYNYGMASTYTDGSSHASVDYDDITEKYVRRKNVKSITYARQVNAIDFNCDGWKEKDGTQIPFTPVNLPKNFYYYGNYLTINHLYVDAPYYAGLFGYVYHPRLYDILLVNPSVTSQMPAHLAEMYEMGVGGLIGTSRDSSHINNCQIYMTQEDGAYHPDKYRVQGECYVGGLIGFCEDEDIQNCSASVYTGYAEGAKKKDGVTPLESRYVGGLIGCITGDSEIENCYAAGNLSGEYVGGLVGYIVDDSDPSGDDYRIQSCYTAGHIEYAAEEAAGILGRISELSGNAKSALSVYGNYCAIIYGTENGKTASGTPDYKWTCTKTDDNGKEIPVPIYGTFKGDGFEWIRTSTLGYSDSYITGSYGGFNYFAGAVFEKENKNYYIAQRGIEYSNSPYFTEMNDKVESVIADLEKYYGVAASALASKAEEAREEVFWLKKLQTLKDLEAVMEEIIYEVDNENGTYKTAEGETRKYTDGGNLYDDSNYTEDIYIDQDRARIEARNSEGHTYIKLTLAQAVHVMYDGTYTDGAGKTQSVTMIYKGSDGDKKKLHDTYGMTNYTFKEYCRLLTEAYNTLLNDGATETEKEAAREKLKFILGDSSSETYVPDSTKPDETRPFYQQGQFYRQFYSDLLYRIFDKSKDYFQDYLKDQNGELIYRYFRDDLCQDTFLEILCDLGMSMDGRDLLVLRAKSAAMDGIIKELTANLTTFDKWRADETDADGNTIRHMKADAGEAKSKTQSAIDAVTELKKLFDGAITDLTTKGSYSYTSEKLKSLMDAATAALQDVKDFFDGEDAYGSGIHRKDVVDYIGKDSDGKWKEGDMRNFRDAVNKYLRDVELCNATANSGVENALAVLATGLKETPALKDGLVEAFKKEINSYLGGDWGNSDSGRRLKNAEELRNAARGFVNGDDSGGEPTREESLGFMYDYQNEHSGNPYKFTSDAYVDGDNGIYNNVFPYLENNFTGYYPFPFVYAREVEGGSRVLYVLFHYGDWLTEDLWAVPTVTYHTEYPEMEGYAGGDDISLSPSRVKNGGAFTPDDDLITSNDENVEVPFYFDGWYTDVNTTIPADEDFYQSIQDAALNGEVKNFDLYAKWTVKPSLTFYAAELEGSYGGRTIPIDTTMTLTSGDKSLTSEEANSYQRFTVWFNPGQEVSLAVSGHYFFMGREDSGPALQGQNNSLYYIIDRLKVVEATIATDMAWFSQEQINQKLGTVTFTVPLGATDSDKYEITLSADGEEGQPEFNICVAEGTMIRMGDGSTKAVEDLEVGDIVLAFNHLTGKYEPTAVWMTPHTEAESKLYRVITLDFSDGSKLKIVGEHGLFDCTLNKYAFINETNYIDFIGHKFSAVTASASGFGGREVTLVNASVSYEMTKIYSPITENHLNIVAEDLLTVTSMMGYGDAVMNIFGYGADMGYDKAQMANDINKYGVYSYDDFADILPQEVYSKVPLSIMKVAVGKGLISYQEVRQIIEYIYKNGYLS